MRVDPVNDHLVERPLKRHICDLALLEVQLAAVLVFGKHRGLRRRHAVIERLRARRGFAAIDIRGSDRTRWSCYGIGASKHGCGDGINNVRGRRGER